MVDYLTRLKYEGKGAFTFKISNELKELTKININSNIIQFKTHQELDIFVKDIEIGIQNNYKFDKNKKSLKDFKDFYDDYLVKKYFNKKI
jgi:hypothetical protein